MRRRMIGLASAMALASRSFPPPLFFDAALFLLLQRLALPQRVVDRFPRETNLQVRALLRGSD